MEGMTDRQFERYLETLYEAISKIINETDDKEEMLKKIEALLKK